MLRIGIFEEGAWPWEALASPRMRVQTAPNAPQRSGLRVIRSCSKEGITNARQDIADGFQKTPKGKATRQAQVAKQGYPAASGATRNACGFVRANQP